MPRDADERDLQLIANNAAASARDMVLKVQEEKGVTEPDENYDEEVEEISPSEQQLDPADVLAKQRGLLALVLAGGDSKKAAAGLRAQGINTDAQQLGQWKRRYATEYTEIQERYKSQVEDLVVKSLRETILVAESAERKALEICLIELAKAQKYHSLKPTDAAIAANNIANIKSKSIDRLLTLTGRPNSIIEERNAEALVRSLQMKGLMKVPVKDDS